MGVLSCRPISLRALATATLVALLALPAAASAQQAAPQYDVVAGAGSTSGADTIRVLARTDPSGGDPVGFATFQITFPGSTRQFPVSGEVTCVSVTLNRAVLNLRDKVFGIVTIGITDGQGIDDDKLGGLIGKRAAADCSPLSSADQDREDIVHGNMVVLDAQPRFDAARARGFFPDGASFLVEASSGPSGENPTGGAGGHGTQGIAFGGGITCLHVSGNTAVVGAAFAIAGVTYLKFKLVDGAIGGQDRWAYTQVPTEEQGSDCSTFPAGVALVPISDGGAVVVVDGSPAP